ncbi:MAG: retropepsin-like aspartic protease [Bacteroidales bacterium]|jgi:predicted aspartyl protease|nr:retropepsin-like aspartic protease [Bacteroidales bacterium]
METQVPFQLIQLENEENLHPIIDAKINNTPIRLVIDTGASHSCIDKKEVKKLLKNKTKVSEDIVMGIGNKRLTNSIVTIKELTIGELAIKDYTIVAINLKHINKMMEMMNLPPINGLLGSDILCKYEALIDYKNRCLTLNY